ncbi:MAG: hypothetical protein L3K17_00320 [Thermoplasmata archaeon]|nr:hypothetical protein [Thermoplasmata archaeon]
MPPRSGQPVRPDGLESSPGPDRAALVVAIAIALVAAIVFEWFAARTPIPPGGDEGTWLLLSYPYVGIAAPSQVQLFSYPPLSFPFLGFSVLVSGGPLLGARIFVGAVIVALGLSAYLLGRSMFRWRLVALFFEAALFLQPDFQQLYYFGAYPNLFGLVFFFLAVAFGLRFLRSRRELHLALFWGSVTAAVLSHALVGVILVALLGIAGILLLAFRRFPRELVTSRVGWLGGGLSVGSSVLYYLGSAIAGTNPPNYLLTTVLTPTQSTQQLGEVFHAFYLEPISLLVHLGAFSFTYGAALALLWGLTIAIVAALAFLRWRSSAAVSDRMIGTSSWFLAVFGVALLSWYLSLTADYRRFTYFLYPANLLLIALGADIALARLWRAWGPTPNADTGRAATEVGDRRVWMWPARDRRNARFSVIVSVAILLLLVSAGVYTLPAASGFEDQNSRVAHGADLVNALGAISRSGIPGAILSVTPLVDRWPATLTGRNLYEVRPPTGYTYTANNLVADELASLSANYRYSVTNGLVVAAIPGLSPTYFNASPLYGFYLDGILQPVFAVSPEAVLVTVSDAGNSSTWHYGPSNSSASGPSVTGSASSLLLTYGGEGVTVTEAITALPGTSQLSVRVTASVSGTEQIDSIALDLSAAATASGSVTASGASAFVWSSPTASGTIATLGQLAAPGVVGPVTNGTGIELVARASPTGGGSNLSIEFTADTPSSSNTASGVAGYYSTPQLWAGWDVRFALLWNGTAVTGGLELSYLETEYGASEFAADGPWTVLLLP